ncbi:flavin-binding monooxygenase [Frondihabitans sucicola]|uniref:Flavin-binding monooxygenase n=1 Tax=Frondihabitans sucicola TaxID=1268041 RepID=A0ABN6XVH0_9MICO|nr:NAD(P)/FAD-dependent oxidoreductase [Frondihabitans sucicola]BDZ48909.1 flavin-binding monooxygenase [Frondihabitans sucicola]
MPGEHLDVLIVGAGLSGIGAACRLSTAFPSRSLAILEAREESGGTWDLFRYPGVRSDSDLFTLGYPFRPWSSPQSIAPAASILAYVRETAEAYGVDRRIRYRHRVVSADWSTEDAHWRVQVDRGDGSAPTTLTCSFLFVCSGYYRYDQGYRPTFPGQDDFAGQIIHPQHWPDDFDATGKRIVVIGSGATGVTLLPALAETAEHVTMLQRSPTYIAALPSADAGFEKLSRRIPVRLASRVSRWKGIARALISYRISRNQPDRMKAMLRSGVSHRLPEGFDVDKHFTPAYDPWDERLCIVPDGDFFRAIRRGTAAVVTDGIDTFTRDGIRLASGDELPADVVVTATGLNLLLFGGMALSMDGEPFDPADRVTYKGMMLDGVPNLAFAIGYTNASWTLKIDLVARYVERILRFQDRHGARTVTPVAPADVGPLEPLIDLASGYIRRGIAQMPKQGRVAPWRLHQNYPRDVRLFRFSRLTGDGLRFSSAEPRRAPERERVS